MNSCKICGLHRSERNGSWCAPCNASYDRWLKTGADGSVLSVVEWGAARAMKFDSARLRLKQVTKVNKK